MGTATKAPSLTTLPPRHLHSFYTRPVYDDDGLQIKVRVANGVPCAKCTCRYTLAENGGQNNVQQRYVRNKIRLDKIKVRDAKVRTLGAIIM